MKRTVIWVRLELEMFHRFEQAAVDTSMRDIAYLGSRHHHFFKLCVGIEVQHGDREIELHRFRRWLRGCLPAEPADFGTQSIEMIADDLHAKIIAEYPGRFVQIEVSEDGVVGATATYEPEAVR